MQERNGKCYKAEDQKHTGYPYKLIFPLKDSELKIPADFNFPIFQN
jgi:hypothetical protein